MRKLRNCYPKWDAQPKWEVVVAADKNVDNGQRSFFFSPSLPPLHPFSSQPQSLSETQNIVLPSQLFCSEKTQQHRIMEPGSCLRKVCDTLFTFFFSSITISMFLNSSKMGLWGVLLNGSLAFVISCLCVWFLFSVRFLAVVYEFLALTQGEQLEKGTKKLRVMNKIRWNSSPKRHHC